MNFSGEIFLGVNIAIPYIYITSPIYWNYEKKQVFFVGRKRKKSMGCGVYIVVSLARRGRRLLGCRTGIELC